MTLLTWSEFVSSTITGERKPKFINVPPEEYDELLSLMLLYGDPKYTYSSPITDRENFLFRGIPMVLDRDCILPEPIYNG